MKVITDFDSPDLTLEQRLFSEAGSEVKTAQCKTETDVIAAGQGVDALLVQYAPVNKTVFEALPSVKITSRYGAGFDTINTDNAKIHGVWVCNSPDYGVHEVASHALAIALNLVRTLARLKEVMGGEICTVGNTAQTYAFAPPTP